MINIGLTDSELIYYIKQNKEEAFKLLFLRYKTKMRKIINKYGLNTVYERDGDFLEGVYFDALNEDEMNNLIIECTTEKVEVYLSNIVDDSKIKPMYSDFFKYNQTKFGMPMDIKELQREQRKTAFSKAGKANSSRKIHK